MRRTAISPASALAAASLLAALALAGCGGSTQPDAAEAPASAPASSTAASTPTAEDTTPSPSQEGTLPGGMHDATVKLSLDGKDVPLDPMGCLSTPISIDFINPDSNSDKGLVLTIDPAGPAVRSLIISTGGHALNSTGDDLTAKESDGTWTVTGTITKYGAKTQKIKVELTATCQ